MEYLVILKKETSEVIKRFNTIKKWFILNFDKNIKKVYFVYEDKVNLDVNSLNFIIIGPNVFPLLTSLPFNNKTKNFISGDRDNCIAFIKLQTPLFSKKKDMKKVININFNHIWEILKIIQHKVDLTINFTPNTVKSSKWFKTEKYEYLLKYLENDYFTWSNLNRLKLRIAGRYPEVIYYEGKNKLESKKIIESMNINCPKTYQVYNDVSEITQQSINNLQDCIIKPTNWDGSKFIFKNFKNKPLNAENIREKMKDFDKKNKSKELMPLIYKTHKPKIIAEEYIRDLKGGTSAPCEFKFYLFNGKIVFFLAINRKANYNKFDFYDENFNQIPNSKLSFERTQINFKWPQFSFFPNLKRDVLKIYEKFNSDLKNSFLGRFVRIDFFVNKDSYWFGEFSLFPNGGSGQNVSSYGKKYFVKCWLPEVFDIFSNKKEKIEKLTLENISEKLENKNPKKKLRFSHSNQNSDKLVDFLFS